MSVNFPLFLGLLLPEIFTRKLLRTTKLITAKIYVSLNPSKYTTMTLTIKSKVKFTNNNNYKVQTGT